MPTQQFAALPDHYLCHLYSLKNPATSIAYAQGNIGTSLAQNVSQSCDYWLNRNLCNWK